VPDDAAIERLRENVSRQEAGGHRRHSPIFPDIRPAVSGIRTTKAGTIRPAAPPLARSFVSA